MTNQKTAPGRSSWQIVAKSPNNKDEESNICDHVEDQQSPEEKFEPPKDLRLLCHFYKSDPLKYSECSNSDTGFKLILQLKEHLYRKHTVYLCNRCKEKFKSEEEVVKHQLKKEICTVASDRIGTDGVTPEISARLRHRGALSGLSDVDKWYAIWDILFPDVTRPFIPWVTSPHDSPHPSSSLEQAARTAGLKYKTIRKWESLRNYLEGEGFDPKLIMRHKDRLFSIFTDSHSEQQDLEPAQHEIQNERTEADTLGGQLPRSSIVNVVGSGFGDINNFQCPPPFSSDYLRGGECNFVDPTLIYMEAKQDQLTNSRSSSITNDDKSRIKLEDNMSIVATENQSGKNEIQDDIRDKLVASFTYKLSSSLELETELRERPFLSIDKQSIAEYLGDFSIKLRYRTSLGLSWLTTIFVDQEKNRIAAALENRLRSTHEVIDKEQNTSTSKDVDRLKWEEKVSKWDIAGAGSPARSSEAITTTSLSKSKEENEDYAIIDLEKAQKYLIESQAYPWLIGKLRAEILLTSRKGTALSKVRIVIFRELAARRHLLGFSEQNLTMQTIRFRVVCDPTLFLQNQFPNLAAPKLGSLIVLNGSEVDAQCSTIEQYVRQTWPTAGPELLKVLEEVVVRGLAESPSEFRLSDGCILQVVLFDVRIIVHATGSDPTLVEIGEILAWITAALRESPSPNLIAYATPRILDEQKTNLSFIVDASIEIQSADSAQLPNGTCWHYLFRNPVVVCGSPILARGDEEKGLEIPLEMMSVLGLTPRATNFDNGLVLKGFSTMFIPMKKVKSSILWHFLFNEDETRMSYLTASKLCSGRLSTNVVDASSLETGRHFLGWSSSVEVFTGSKDVNYDGIGWTGPDKFAGAGFALDKVTISAGKILNAGAVFTRGTRDTPLNLTGFRTYEEEIYVAERMRVVLYDIKSRRGWLVNGASALLHLACTQLVTVWSQRSRLFKKQDFQYANPADGVMGASVALLDDINRAMAISQKVERWKEEVETVSDPTAMPNTVTKKEYRKVTDWTFEDLVRQIYHVLEQMQDYQLKMLTSTGVNLRFTDRDKLEGFDFMDVVDGPSVILPKVVILKRSGKGWMDFTRSIRAITLLGKDFGEIMKPGEGSNTLCKNWRHIPAGRDYLTASISTLHHICKREGDRHAKPMALCRGVYWHKAHLMFESCTCKPGKQSSSCDRIQVLLPPSLGPKIHPQPFEYMDGAVIFGKSKRLRWKWPQIGDPTPGDISESDCDEFHREDDSGHGTSLQSSSSNDGNISEMFSPIPETSTTPTSQEHVPVLMSGPLGEIEDTRRPQFTSSTPEEEQYKGGIQSPASYVKEEDDGEAAKIPSSILSPLKKGTKNLDLRQAFHKRSETRGDRQKRREQMHAKRTQENVEDSLDDMVLSPSKRMKSKHSTIPTLKISPSPS